MAMGAKCFIAERLFLVRLQSSTTSLYLAITLNTIFL